MSLAHLAALPQNRDMDELIPRVREVLSTTPGRWEALAGSIQLELLRRRPTPDDWSALECLQHILDAEIGAFGVRLAAFMDGRDLTAFDPDAADFRPELTSAPPPLRPDSPRPGPATSRLWRRLCLPTWRVLPITPNMAG